MASPRTGSEHRLQNELSTRAWTGGGLGVFVFCVFFCWGGRRGRRGGGEGGGEGGEGGWEGGEGGRRGGRGALHGPKVYLKLDP